MIKVGQHNTLTVLRDTSVGMYLGDKKGNDILLPKKYIPKDVQVDDQLEVFVYKDSEDRPVATTLEPYILLDTFAPLQVKDVNRFGAFMDWGLEKDLLIPFSEQASNMEKGRWYVVYLYLDLETNRLAASTKLNQFLEFEKIELEPKQKVEILVSGITDIGFKVIIDQTYSGLIYKNEVFKPLRIGDKSEAYIKTIRDDNKIDVTLQEPGYGSVTTSADLILNFLNENEGYLHITDKSSPEEIKEEFKISKKEFKKAVGQLYKKRLIKIEQTGIFLSKRKY